LPSRVFTLQRIARCAAGAFEILTPYAEIIGVMKAKLIQARLLSQSESVELPDAGSDVKMIYAMYYLKLYYLDVLKSFFLETIIC